MADRSARSARSTSSTRSATPARSGRSAGSAGSGKPRAGSERAVSKAEAQARPAGPPGVTGDGPSWPDSGLVGLGIGLAATGVGTLLGLAAERVAVARRIRPNPDVEDDGRGGPPLGSLRGEARVVISDGVPLHVEVDDVEAYAKIAPAHLDANDHYYTDHTIDAGGLHGATTPDDASGPVNGESVSDGPALTVVMSHGYALTLDSWHYQRLELRGRYRLVLWDQRGHGRSGTGPEGSSTIDQVGADLAAVIDEVAPEGPLVLLGHSMGGMTVMSLAALRPELFAERVFGVGLISTSAGGEGGVDLGFAGLSRLLVRVAPATARLLAKQGALVARGRRLGSDLESVMVRRYSFASPVPWQLVAFAAQMIARTRVEVISDFLPTFGTHDKRAALEAMSGHDVLVLVGDSDVLIPAIASQQIADLIPGSEHVVVADAGHLVTLEHPHQVTEPIEALLQRAAASAGARARPGRRHGWRRRTVTPTRTRWTARLDRKERKERRRGGGQP